MPKELSELHKHCREEIRLIKLSYADQIGKERVISTVFMTLGWMAAYFLYTTR